MDQLPIDALLDVSGEFAMYLKQRRYSANSVRTYCQNARLLYRRAEELGWLSSNQAAAEAWRPVLQALKTVPRSPKSLVRFAIAKGKGPSDFRETDLQAWCKSMELRGHKHATVRFLKGLFRRTILQAGLESLLPNFNCRPYPTKYGVPTRDLPEPLRNELIALLQWKQARFAKGRPQRARHRAVSAYILESWINRLYGFAKNVGKYSNINTLIGLVREDVVTSFAEWALNERHLSRGSMMKLSMIYGAVRHHPDYKGQNWEWFSTLFSMLPEDQEAVRLAKKAAKTLPYDVLCTVPVRIREKRLKMKCNAWHTSWLVMEELLITWLTILPWRQRNIRECRLGEPETANVFYGQLSTLVHIAKPQWVEDALRVNPAEKFWQFHFQEDETKTGNSVRGILPRRLIPLLEDYLQNHRPNIVAAIDPGTLFLNQSGGARDRQATTDLVAQLVLEHAGRRVTPHIYRDIFAYAWLDDHPEDFLTLSKILWHQNINTTLRTYGRNFDESNGVRRIDDWLASRSAK
jgi:integrase